MGDDSPGSLSKWPFPSTFLLALTIVVGGDGGERVGLGRGGGGHLCSHHLCLEKIPLALSQDVVTVSHTQSSAPLRARYPPGV